MSNCDYENYEYSDGNSLCCPYCKSEFEYTGDPIGQDEEIENNCPDYGKDFVSVADYSRSFNNYKKESDDTNSEEVEK